MRGGASILWMLAFASVSSAIDLLQNEPVILYNEISPKLRIITKSSAFSGRSIYFIADPNH